MPKETVSYGVDFIVMKHTFLLKSVMDRMGIIQNIWNLETGEIFSHIKQNWPWQKTKVTLLKWGSFKELCNSLISDVVILHFCQPMFPQGTRPKAVPFTWCFLPESFLEIFSVIRRKNLRDLYCSYLVSTCGELPPGGSKDWRRRQG